MTLDPETLDLILDEAVELDRKARPSLFYQPHNRGQQQFHASKHTVRALFPGNRFGKTTAMANEVQWQVEAKDRARILWICPQYKQFFNLQAQLEDEVFGKVQYDQTDNCYKWPNDSIMYVIPRERDWEFVQGINPDLVCVDEECPIQLWRELRARGFGRNNTRYIIAATATNMAGSWMEKEIYRVWLDYHHKLGLDEQGAIREQRHPDFFVWPRGGIADNPSMTPEKVTAWRALTWGSDKEKKVRDEGGFETSVGDPVFDPAGIEWLRQRRRELLAQTPGRVGFLERALRGSETREEVEKGRCILNLDPKELAERDFVFTDVADPSGRFEVWSRPEHACAMGGDFAYGIQGRDYDAIVVMDPQPTPEGRYRQAGELHGHWGPVMHKITYAAMRFWSESFLLGERQVGHFTLHTLWNEYGERNLYRERAKDKPNHPMNLSLGHPKVQDDVMIRAFRAAVRDKRVELLSEALIEQMALCVYFDPKEKRTEEKAPDDGLKVKLLGGGSPDLMVAAAYAYAAVQEMPPLEFRRKPYAPDTLGAILGHNEFEGLDEEDCGPTWVTRRR